MTVTPKIMTVGDVILDHLDVRQMCKLQHLHRMVNMVNRFILHGLTLGKPSKKKSKKGDIVHKGR